MILFSSRVIFEVLYLLVILNLSAKTVTEMLANIKL